MFDFLKRSEVPTRSEPAMRVPEEDLKPSVPSAGRPRLSHRRPRAARSYDAGETDGATASWTTTPLTADQVVDRNQRILVARSRDQAGRNDYLKAFLRLCRQNVIGSRGIILQAQAKDKDGKLDQVSNDALEEWFREWGRPENCDIRGRRSFRMLCQSLLVTTAKDGEFMVRMIRGRNAGPMGFALQTLDPQRCPVDFNIERLANGRFVRQGIEYNRVGRALAFYFLSSDPANSSYSFAGGKLERVPAQEIIHGFVEEIEGQRRGFPWASTSLWRLNQLAGFENAALVNARSAAKLGGFLEWENGEGPDRDDAFEEDEVLELESEEGIYQELPPGLKAKEIKSQYPNGEFAPFHKAMLRGAGAGMGVSYVSFANDLEGVNFSSIRQGVLDEREHWMDLQEWFIEILVDRVYQEALRIALLRGDVRTSAGPLKAAEFEKFRRVSWQARRWAWVDPQKDINSEVTAKNNLLTAPSDIIRKQGKDPRTVFRQYAADIAEMRGANIPEEFIMAAVLGVMPGAPPVAPPPKDGDDDENDDE